MSNALAKLAALSNKNTVASTSEKEKAKVWVNIGYEVEVDGVKIFVSLPFGTPLDTMNAIPRRGNNQEWLNIVDAKNALLEQLLDVANNIAPGESVLVPEGVLKIEIRRVSEESAPSNASSNPLMKKLF